MRKLARILAVSSCLAKIGTLVADLASLLYAIPKNHR
jgi:hypothetical protein